MDVQLCTSRDLFHLDQSLDETKLPSVENFVCLIKKCRVKRSLTYARYVHLYIHETGLEAHRVVGNHLVPMLVDCGNVSDAKKTFQRLYYRNEYSWTSLIQGYVEREEFYNALNLYQQMQELNVVPSRYTLQAILRACSKLKNLGMGCEVHDDITKKGYDLDAFVGNTLVVMYAKCFSFTEAWHVFQTLTSRDTVSWNALISGCTENMLFEQVFVYLNLMQMDGLYPNIFTFLCSLKACVNAGSISHGHQLHADIVLEGLENDPFIGNTLVDMYAKFGLLKEAKEVFDDLAIRGVDSWNAMITGYAEHGLVERALKCLEEMNQDGFSPDSVTYICSLKACGDAGFIENGRGLYCQLVKEGFKLSSFLGNTLVDMYAKCGLVKEAESIFERLFVHDIVSWNALIAGYARYGDSEHVFRLFETMVKECIPPDWITFLCLLSVCSHTGLVSKAQQILETMVTNYHILPTAKFHNCIVALFARAGQLDEASEMMFVFDFDFDSSICKTVLAGCQMGGSLEIAERAFMYAMAVNKNDVKACVLMSNLVADAHAWEIVDVTSAVE